MHVLYRKYRNRYIGIVRCIYDSIQDQKEKGVSISITWKSTDSDDELLNVAKRKAKDATREGARPEQQFPKMLSTTFNIEKRKLRAERHIPENVGKYSKSIDTALPSEEDRLWACRRQRLILDVYK